MLDISYIHLQIPSYCPCKSGGARERPTWLTRGSRQGDPCAFEWNSLMSASLTGQGGRQDGDKVKERRDSPK